MITSNFEKNLCVATQPIRYFALAATLFHFFEKGLYDALARRPATSSELAYELGLDQDKLQGMLNYLENENIVYSIDDLISLTTYGRSFADSRAWYTMMIGGYGQTFLEMGQSLVKDAGPCSRNIVHVGVGSCGISEFDAFPLTKSLVASMPAKPQTIIDLGCGNAMYLTQFARHFPGVRAIGVEPSEASCMAARAYIAENACQANIEVVCDDAARFVQRADYKVDLYVLGFVLHEILGQQGEDGVIAFLSAIRKASPSTHIAVIEVDNQIRNANAMQHALGQTYYNPYYLLHYFTNQRLETRGYWRNLFHRVGYDVMTEDTTLACVDSTQLEIGFLLKARGEQG